MTNNQIAHLLRAEYRFENSAKTASVHIISCAGEPTDHAFQTNQPKFLNLLARDYHRFHFPRTHSLLRIKTRGFWDIFTLIAPKKTDQAKIFPLAVASVGCHLSTIFCEIRMCW